MKKNHNCLFFDCYHDFRIFICSIVLIILFVILIFISIFYKFNFSTSYDGYIVYEEGYYVVVCLNDNELQSIKKNILVFDKKKQDFDIVKISDEYILSNNGPVRSVYLSFNFDDKYKIINNILKINFVNKNTIFNVVKGMFF